MRLNLILTANKHPVPFDYQHSLTEVFNRWTDTRELKNKIKLFSLSWLQGSKAVDGNLNFPQGARWFISFYGSWATNKLIDVIKNDPEIFYGMRVASVRAQTTPHFGSRFVFKVGSPVLARSLNNRNPDRHFVYNEPEANQILTLTLREKINAAGLGESHSNVKVSFDSSYPFAKTKLVRINERANKTSVCPVIVEGTPEALEFAWNVGVGHGTGEGFGALM